MTDSEKADFLMFSTGSPLVPFGGFKNLKGLNGPKKFTITKDSHPEHLIKAHTWYTFPLIISFYRVDLPEYPSKEVLRDKLFKSLREGGPEFDLSWSKLLIKNYQLNYMNELSVQQYHLFREFLHQEPNRKRSRQFCVQDCASIDLERVCSQSYRKKVRINSPTKWGFLAHETIQPQHREITSTFRG